MYRQLKFILMYIYKIVYYNYKLFNTIYNIVLYILSSSFVFKTVVR